VGSGGKSKRPKGRAGVAALQVGSVVITFDPAGESNRVAVKLSEQPRQISDASE
jgi:hypothetical protein